MRLSCKGWFVISHYGDGNCSRRATVRLGIDTLIANILVFIAALNAKQSTLLDTVVQSGGDTGRLQLHCSITVVVRHNTLLLTATNKHLSSSSALVYTVSGKKVSLLLPLTLPNMLTDFRNSLRMQV